MMQPRTLRIPFSWFLPVLAATLVGCGSNEPSKQATVDLLKQQTAADKQLLTQIEALPQEQRAQFFRSHFPQFRGMISDPDPDVRAAYTALMKQH
jgi:outer membrane PBP1 activator LpoA protein